MHLHGKNIIGEKSSAAGTVSFTVAAPRSGEKLSPEFYEATDAEIEEALTIAERAFEGYRAQPAEKVAAFLERIAEEILRLGQELIRRANAETALPEQRLIGERLRTVNQIKMFASLVREGSWLEASIDRAQPQRQPLPKPDLRRMLIPIGPVAVFGASNFPLAFSVAGGDTASALAAGNPVVAKAHPAHPGTSELVARAIQAAVAATQMAPGVFSMLHGRSHEMGMRWSGTLRSGPSASLARSGLAVRCSMSPRPGLSQSPFTQRWAAPTRSLCCLGPWGKARTPSPRACCNR
jgi:2,5-dioxopentanoate dehydrogenase